MKLMSAMAPVSILGQCTPHSNQCPLSTHINITLQIRLLPPILLSFCAGLEGKMKGRIMYCDSSLSVSLFLFKREEDIVFLSLQLRYEMNLNWTWRTRGKFISAVSYSGHSFPRAP